MAPRSEEKLTLAAGALVFVLAFCANAWMLRLEFQNDDYREIPSAAMKLGLERPADDEPWYEVLRTQAYSYRPVLWAVLLVLWRLSGEHPDPVIFHFFFLSAHALASVLVWRIFGARLGSLAGMVGGVLFGVLPGGIQAASWVAAGGDQLAVLFMLVAGVASDRVLRRGSGWGIACCGLAVGCAVLAKETAVVLLPALALLWVIPPRGATPDLRRRAGLVTAATVGTIAAWSLRTAVLATWIPMYWGGEWASPLSTLGALPTALRGFLVPWHAPGASLNLDPATPRLIEALGLGGEVVSAAFTTIVAAAIVLPVLLGFAFAPTRLRLAMLALTLLALAAILPVLPVTTPEGLDASRALYPTSLMLSAIAASSASALASRNRLLIVAFAPFFLLSADLLVHVARTELLVAEKIRAARKDLDDAFGRDDGVRVVVITPPDWLRSVPFLGQRFALAVAPPFGHARHAPLLWPNAATLRWCPPIRVERAPLRIMEWNGSRFADLHPVLPRIPETAPPLEEDPGAPSIYRPVGAIPPRGIAAIRIDEASATGAAAGAFTIAAGAQSREIPFKLSGDGPHVMALPDDAFDEAWFREPSVDSVRVVGPRLARPPVLLVSLPAIVVQRPNDGQLSLRSTPRLAFRSEAPAQSFRVTIAWLADTVSMALSWTVAASAAAGEGGACEFVANQPAWVVIAGQVAARVGWSDVATRLGPSAQGRFWSIPVGLRVEGLDASGINVIARSEWLPFTIVR